MWLITSNADQTDSVCIGTKKPRARDPITQTLIVQLKVQKGAPQSLGLLFFSPLHVIFLDVSPFRKENDT